TQLIFLEASSHAERACDLREEGRGVRQTPTSSLRRTRWRTRGTCPALRVQARVESVSPLRPARTLQRRPLLREKASSEKLYSVGHSRRRLARGSVEQAFSEVRLKGRGYA